MIVAIMQARMGSTRLPGKVLIDIQGKPLLEHIVDRVKRSKLIAMTIIATTVNEKDKAIIELAENLDIPYYVGSEDDVLDRFYQTAKKYKAETIVRITSDEPFLDPEITDKVVGYYLKCKDSIDYVSNTIKPTYPDGLDTEVFSFKALERAWREAKKPSEREHVTPYIWNHPELFRLANVENEEDLSHLRWTLDDDADLKFTQEIYARLYHGNIFLMQDILNLLAKNPWLVDINKGTLRDEGYLKSIQAES